MFTVSSYRFHAVASKFIRLWRYVQIVSDMLTLILGLFCCMCWDTMPISSLSSYSSKHSDLFRKPETDVYRANGETLLTRQIVKDFTPLVNKGVADIKSQEFQPLVIPQDQFKYITAEPVTSTPFEAPYRVTVPAASTLEGTNFPAVHATKKRDGKSTVPTEFFADT